MEEAVLDTLVMCIEGSRSIPVHVRLSVARVLLTSLSESTGGNVINSHGDFKSSELQIMPYTG